MKNVNDKSENLNEKNGIKSVTEKSKKFAELMQKAEKINISALSEKTTANRSIWKKELFANYKTEKTARRILRKKQFELSKKVIKFSKLNDKSSLENSIKELESFYKSSLVDRSKFTNISIDKEQGMLINLASEISQNS
jgi:hypothetical protein